MIARHRLEEDLGSPRSDGRACAFRSIWSSARSPGYVKRRAYDLIWSTAPSRSSEALIDQLAEGGRWRAMIETGHAPLRRPQGGDGFGMLASPTRAGNPSGLREAPAIQF